MPAGLYVSIILGAYEVSFGALKRLNEAAKKQSRKVFKEITEALTGTAMDYLTRPIAWLIMLFYFGFTLIYLYRIECWIRPCKTLKGYSPTK